MVLSVLEKYPEARDSDQWLTIKIWTIYFPSMIAPLKDNRPGVALRDIMQLPREDNVKRIRAKIQNEEHRFLPTTKAVAMQRKINEDVWENYCRSN